MKVGCKLMNNSEINTYKWETTELRSFQETMEVLLELQVHHWVSRGHSKLICSLFPLIDRTPREKLNRSEKIDLERSSIELFRSIAKNFASPEEKLNTKTDITTLMVLQHYGVPTRLLDWTHSPYIAAYFASSKDVSEDGEIWSFDEHQYEIMGDAQWKKYPETIVDGKFDKRMTTAFSKDYQGDWLLCQFNYIGFPRYDAQQALFSFTSQFNQDHAQSIKKLLIDSKYFHRYIIKGGIKSKIKECPFNNYGIWRGMLYPDTAGAAGTVRELFPQ